MAGSARVRRLVFVVMMTARLSAAGQQTPALRPAVAVEPVEAILDAFRSHSVVALGEGHHGNEQGHAFRLRLIRDPRFAATVNDIVVEFGSAHNQPLIDRFIRGEDVADVELRRVWQETTQQQRGVWDKAIYEEFFRAVRALNASHPRERQVRVLLGDPPVSRPAPAAVDVRTELVRERDSHAASVVQREVLAKQRRALLIYGDMHFIRWPTSLVGILEREARVQVFNIKNAMLTSYDSLNQAQNDIASWPVPSLAMVAGTVLVKTEFSYFDAVLYLGPPSTITFSRVPPSLCADRAYIAIRKERLKILGYSQPKAEEVLAQECPP